MEKKQIESKTIKKPEKVLLTCFQACNELKLNGRNRRVAISMFNHLNLIKNDWSVKFKKNKLM